MGKKFIILKLLLSDISKAYEKLPECPLPDNQDLLIVEYSSVYTARKVTRTGYYLRKMLPQLFAPLPFEISYFKQLLDHLIQEREAQGYTQDSIIKLNTSKNPNFIVWGDLNSSLQSFLRALEELKAKKIIDDYGKIIDASYYFVFLGDVINLGPYSVDVLALVMHLMAINPQNIIYLRGDHETNHLWQEYNLARELHIRAQHYAQNYVPFCDEINRFFKTLPYALYLQVPKNNEFQFVRLSHERIVKDIFDINEISPALRKTDTEYEKIKIIPTKKPFTGISAHYTTAKQEQAVELEAIICSENSSRVFLATDGLSLQASHNGAIVWTPFSAPNKTFQELFNFYNDAFCILEAKGSVDEWSISLLKQDIRKKSGFEKSSFNFMVGYDMTVSALQALQAPAHLRFTEDIVIGSTLDLSRTSRIAGARLKNGIELRMNQENAAGGVHGKRLKMVFLDDGYTPTQALQNVERLATQFHTDILLSPVGSPTIEALRPALQQEKIHIYFPYTGLDSIRDPGLKGITHYRAAYKLEIQALIEYGINVLKSNSFGFFFQEDAYGFGAIATAKEVLNKYGIKDWVEAGYSRNSLDPDLAVKKMQEGSPEIIIFISTFGPSASFVRKIGVPFLFNKKCMGFSFLTDVFRTFLAKKGLNLTIARVVPDFICSSPIEIVQDYLNAQHKYPLREDISWDSLEGYINASLFIEALHQITGPITKEKITQQIASWEKFDYKGLQLNFDHHTRSFSKNIVIDTGSKLISWTHQGE